MRAVVLAAALLATPAAAEPLPSGSLGLVFGGAGGTGASAKRLGLGYLQFGGQAAWQPMTTEQRFGWSVRSQFMFGRMYGADAARIDEVLRTLQMDFLVGVRLRPGANPRRYLTLHGGLELFRANQPIPPSQTQRAFAGGVVQAGVEQYAFGVLLINVDVRYGLLFSSPAEIALLVGASLAVP